MTHGAWLTQCESLWVTHAVWLTVWLTMCASHWITYGVIHGVTHGVLLRVCDSRCVTHGAWLTEGISSNGSPFTLPPSFWGGPFRLFLFSSHCALSSFSSSWFLVFSALLFSLFTVTSFSNDSPFSDRACSPLPVRLSFPWSSPIALGSLDSASATVGKSFLCSTPFWSYNVVWFVSFSL